jgi:hypothetical protein
LQQRRVDLGEDPAAFVGADVGRGGGENGER